jgi:hypothetical protein
MENLGMFYDHLVYFTVIENFFGPFGIFLWSFGIFSPRFGILYHEKSGNPAKDLGPSLLLTWWEKTRRNYEETLRNQITTMSVKTACHACWRNTSRTKILKIIFAR